MIVLKRFLLKGFYLRPQPLDLGLLPAVQAGQVSQGLVLRGECAVNKQRPTVAALVFQLVIVLVVELGRVGVAPLITVLVSQVDDGGAMS